MQKFTLFFLFSMLIASQLAAQINLFPYGSSWKYLDNGSNQGTAWRGTSYQDGAWKTGRGTFGFKHGNGNGNNKEFATVIDYGGDRKNKYITTYFRKTVQIANAAAYSSYLGTVLREDDGVVVYVNGVEVYRTHMPGGTINYKTLATHSGSSSGLQTFTIKGSAFTSGANVIAVEVHLRKEDASKMAFGLSLAGIPAIIDRTAPTVRSINRQSPSSATTNAATLTFRAVFSEKVTGVNAPDFKVTTVSGSAAGSVSTVNPVGSDGTTYDVTVSGVSGQGVLRLDLKDSGTDIKDIAGNNIGSGFTNGQTYTIDQVAPIVLSISRYQPTSSTTTVTSVIYRVIFSEAVTGVGTSDFELAKTGSATGTIASVSGSGSTYNITVNAITGTGTLRLDLKASGTGITDAAGNAISGGFTTGQVYTVQPADVTAPTVLSINRHSPANENTTANTVTFRVTFSEAVTGVNTADFTLATTNTVKGSIASVTGSGATYDVVVNAITGTGTLGLLLNSSGTGITDAAGNSINGGFSSGQTYTIEEADVTAPEVVSINRQSPAAETTTATSVTFRITFSEAVKGVGIDDFVLTNTGSVNGTIASITGSSSTYDVTVNTITGAGTLRLDLNASGTGITDGAGNAISGGFTSGQTYTIEQADVTAPVVQSINRHQPSTQPTTATTVIFRVIFSEAVTGVNAADFTVTKTNTVNGGITAVNGSGTTYDVTVSGITGSGSLGLDLNSSGTGITDAAGNPINGGFTTGQTYSIVEADVTAPSVLSINRHSPTSQSTTATTVTFRVTFSEAVTGVNSADFTLATTNTVNGTIASVSGSDAIYDVVVNAISGTGTLGLHLNATGTGITDAAGNAISGGFTAGQTYTIEQADVTAPQVSGIVRHTPATESTTASEVVYAVTFSEAVSGVDLSDFTLTQGGTATGTLAALTGSGSSYLLTVNGISGTGTLRLDVKASGTGISDAAGNGLSGGFVGGESYSVSPADVTAPAVVSGNRQSPATESTTATSVTFRVTFSEAVTGVGTDDFALTSTGSATGTIASLSGSGSTYDVTVNAIAGTGTLRLDLKASGTGIEDAAGNGISGGFTTGQTYKVQPADITAPTVESINRKSPATENTTATNVTFQVVFSEPVTGVDASDFTVTKTNTVNGSITSVTGSGTTYDITVSSITGAGTLGLHLNSSGTGITDAAGNGINGGFTSGQTYNIEEADVTAPVVQSINRHQPTTESTSATSVVFRAIFSEAVTGVSASDFSLTKDGTADGTIAAVSGSGTTYDITVNSITGNGTLRLDLNASGTGITDAAGNPINGGFTEGQSYAITQPVVTYGFSSVKQLNPVSVGVDTRGKPQGKTWKYDDKWWCVLAPNTGGTWLYRLDGTTWTPVRQLVSSGGRADYWLVDNVIHILVYRGTLTSSIVSLQYDDANDTYIPWSQRTSNTSIVFPAGSETASMTIDGTGRMWVANAGTTEVKVWWSDAPYSSWGGSVTLADNITDDDICGIMRLQGKVGVFWSNQATRRFGFKTHTDGADPTVWSADEVPGGGSALDQIGNGMADNHMNFITSSNGTLYSAVKTGYDRTGYPQLMLLVRRPSGNWDEPYPVVVNDGSAEGTMPIVILNEALGRIKVVYTTITNGGYIAYRESSTSNISFGATKILISEAGTVYNFAASTHQTYNPEVVILATRQGVSPLQMVSVIASDVASENIPPSITATDLLNRQLMGLEPAGSLQLYPNPVITHTTLSYTVAESGKYALSLYDSRGNRLSILKEGTAGAGQKGTVVLDASSLKSGLYFIKLQTGKGRIVTQKVLIQK